MLTFRSVATLSEYVALFDFRAVPFVDAVRLFLSPFRLPGEAQKIDRIMSAFAKTYVTQNPPGSLPCGDFGSEDAAYVLAFSVVMLNTDAHSSHVRRKMTREEFVKNNRGIDVDGSDLPREMLMKVYDDVASSEIKTGTEFDDLAENELVEWLGRGRLRPRSIYVYIYIGVIYVYIYT